MTDVTFSKREISVAPGGGHEPSFVAFVRAHLLHFQWTHFRSFSFCRSFPLLARAIGVGVLLSFLAVLSFSPSGDEEETVRSERPYRLARVRVPPSGPASLSKDGGEEVLDSDFVIEQAALTWSHRRDDGTDVADGLGVMRFGPVKVHQSVVEHVVKAAKTTEMDPALLMAIADKESNFSLRAKARTSTASGLFQFVEKTWLHAIKIFGGRHGRAEESKAVAGQEGVSLNASPLKRSQILNLRMDPYLSAVLAAEMLKKDGAKIAEKIGRPLTAGETYLIHFLGTDDAEKFLNVLEENPNLSAAALLPRPARANRPIFYESRGGRLSARSVRDVHEAFEAMMGSRTSRYEDVADKLLEDLN
ncbi:MAG: transglycosylase SLT domain-containing protein [Methylocystis sp.]